MVRASNRSSEGCGFDPHLGVRNHFLSIELEDCSPTLIYPSSHVSQTSNCFVNIVVSYGKKTFGKLVRETSAGLTYVECMVFIAGYAINDVRGGAYEVMRNNKIRFGSTNDGGLIKRRTRVAASSSLIRLLCRKEINGFSVKIEDVSESFFKMLKLRVIISLTL